MKRLYVLSVFFLFLSMGVAAQQKEYSGQMHVTPLVLEQRGDSLYMKLNFDISGVNVDSRYSISLIPSLVAPSDRLDLPAVMVKGRESYNVHTREMALMNKSERELYSKTAPYAVLKGFNAVDSKSVEYSKAIKYEPWMAVARLDMYEDLCGCANAPRRMGVTMLVNEVALEKIIIIEPYVVTPYLSFVQPAVERVKYREIQGEAFLDFVVNKTDIRPDYMNNPRELKKITDLIADVNDDKSIEVKAIKVDGFASPEGSYANNKYLSEGRANALVDYLVTRFKFPKDMYKVHFGGENWAGLMELVLQSDIDRKEDILTILGDAKITDDQRKSLLKKLTGGVPYAFMLREWYPGLRKASCRIEFRVKGFDVAEAKEVFRSRPQNLSLNEMFSVASTYEKGSQDFIDLFETAARIFPNDVTANLNAATAALSRGDVIYAQRYLDKIKVAPPTADYYNTLGVLAMLKGEYSAAETELKKAAAMGLAEATKNLAEIAAKRENMQQISEQKSAK